MWGLFAKASAQQTRAGGNASHGDLFGALIRSVAQ